MKTRYDITFGRQYDRHGNPLTDLGSSKLAILGKAAKTFGGATWIDHDGSYVHDGGRLVIERSATIVLILDHALGYDGSLATGFASWVCKVLNQESVLVAWQMIDAQFVREE